MVVESAFSWVGGVDGGFTIRRRYHRVGHRYRIWVCCVFVVWLLLLVVFSLLLLLSRFWYCICSESCRCVVQGCINVYGMKRISTFISVGIIFTHQYPGGRLPCRCGRCDRNHILTSELLWSKTHQKPQEDSTKTTLCSTRATYPSHHTPTALYRKG